MLDWIKYYDYQDFLFNFLEHLIKGDIKASMRNLFGTLNNECVQCSYGGFFPYIWARSGTEDDVEVNLSTELR